MSILISTPCYGGQVTAHHFKSCLELRSVLQRAGVEHDWNIGWNESLVQRARNSMAAAFLKTTFRKLLFIDADIEFLAEDVAKLWNLDADVCAGVYSMKRPDAPLAAWRNGKLLYRKDCPKEPFEADFAGTGFMMIDRSVFERMKNECPEREHDEAIIGGKSFLWFHPRLSSDGGSFYMSEDFAFCHDWRGMGGKILVDPSIKLKHWGSVAYA